MPDLSALFTAEVIIYMVRALLWLCLVLLVWLWLKGELTPARFLTIFESEGVLSIRLILAAAWSIFIMCMLAAGRFTVDEAVRLNAITELLLLYGTAKVLGKAWAERPPAPAPTIKVKQAEVEDVNLNPDNK